MIPKNPFHLHIYLKNCHFSLIFHLRERITLCLGKFFGMEKKNKRWKKGGKVKLKEKYFSPFVFKHWMFERKMKRKKKIF